MKIKSKEVQNVMHDKHDKAPLAYLISNDKLNVWNQY